MFPRIGLAAVLVGLGAVPVRAAPFHASYQVRGLGTYFGVTSPIGGGCGYSDLTVWAVEDTNHEAGGGAPPAASSGGYVAWVSYNFCTGEYYSGWGQGTFAIGGGTGGMTVRTSLPASICTNEGCFDTIEIDVTVTPTGEYSGRGVNNWHDATPTMRFHSRSVGSYADAVASGSVTVGSTNLLVGDYPFGFIQQTNSGSVVIDRFE